MYKNQAPSRMLVIHFRYEGALLRRIRFQTHGYLYWHGLSKARDHRRGLRSRLRPRLCLRRRWPKSGGDVKIGFSESVDVFVGGDVPTAVQQTFRDVSVYYATRIVSISNHHQASVACVHKSMPTHR